MAGGKSKEEKSIIKRLEDRFEVVKFVINNKNNNLAINFDVEDFSIAKYDFEIVDFLNREISDKSYIYNYLESVLNYLFKNELSRDKYKSNNKDFNINEFKLKLIRANQNMALNFDVSVNIEFNENNEIIYQDFLFKNISFNEYFEEIFNKNLKKLEKIKDSIETITGEYNSQYQTLKNKMFEDIEKIFEAVKGDENE